MLAEGTAGASSTAGTATGGRAEDDEAFRAFFLAQFPALSGFCSGLTGSRGTGEELAQEALVRTWGRWRQVREPRAYAYLVATNLARKHWRSAAREQLGDPAVDLDRAAVSPVDLGLRDLVDRLPDRLRVPVLLHYYADVPIEEVARLMHRPAGSVRQRLHEARKRLARDYGEDS